MFGLSGFSARQFDFPPCDSMRRAYIVAASYRCGSTYLCTEMWRTGVLGAPMEYLNYEGDTRLLYSRLRADSPADYLQKLIACRTSPNGIFGLKVHFHHFRTALHQFPGLLDLLNPVQFICLSRRDKVAQAVSLAKAFQTRAWMSLNPERRACTFYSREFIQECLEEVHAQEQQWNDWFKRHSILPLRIEYEGFMESPAETLDSLKRALGCEDSTSPEVPLPPVRRQSDNTNDDWIRRFVSEDGTAARSTG
jgi:LPS sulfotransferase NodH